MGAGFCSLYREIHYIKVRYIKVWVYISRHKEDCQCQIHMKKEEVSHAPISFRAFGHLKWRAIDVTIIVVRGEQYQCVAFFKLENIIHKWNDLTKYLKSSIWVIKSPSHLLLHNSTLCKWKPCTTLLDLSG